MRGNQKNKNYKIKWSPEFAYAVGLIATDGNLSSDGRHLEITSKDLQLLNTFRRCLGLKNKIGLKTGGFSNKKYPRVQFGNIILYRWLLGIGLTPHKSKTISKLKIPEKYFFDFLRGHFDGDGSCYSYWDPRWKNSFMFYIVFVSASRPHIDWLREKIKKLAGIKGHITQDGGKNTWQLKYAKKESKILIYKFYHKENIPCLERKRQKLLVILRTDKKERNAIPLNARVAKLENAPL